MATLTLSLPVAGPFFSSEMVEAVQPHHKCPQCGFRKFAHNMH